MTLLAYRTANASGFTRRTPLATRQSKVTTYLGISRDYVDIFNIALAKWKSEAIAMSSAADQMSLPAFLQIVAMGEKVIPLIIDDLKSDPSFIFLALRSITRENPVPDSAIGRPSEMIKAWLAWATENGHGTN